MQKDKTFRIRLYQCFHTDRGDEKRKGEVLTLIPSNINAYMSTVQQTVLDRLHNELNTAKYIAEYVPRSVFNTALKQINTMFIRAMNYASRKSWMTKTADINMEKYVKKLWRLTKQLKDEGSIYSNITLYTIRHFNTCWERS